MKQPTSSSKTNKNTAAAKKKNDSNIFRLAALLRNPGKAGGVTNLLMITRMSFAIFLVVLALIAITVYSAYSNNIPASDPAHDAITVDYLEDFNTMGTIYDRNGIVIAETPVDENGTVYDRVYYYIDSMSHLIGSSYGEGGVEAYFHSDLIGYRRDNIKAGRGDDVYLTIDAQLQEQLYALLDDIDVGGVVVSDAKTGAVLSMISVPGYDFTLSSDEATQIYHSGEFINNCMAGLTPGSVGKLMTACILAEDGFDPEITDYGSVEFGEKIEPVRNYEGTSYNKIHMTEAIKESSNVWFSSAAWQYCNRSGSFNTAHFVNGMKKLGMEDAIDTQLGKIYQGHKITNDDPNELVQSSFGQGKLLVSPLYMNILTSAIVTGGTMKTPWFISHTQSPKGKIVTRTVEQDLPYSVSPEAAAKVREGMLAAGSLEYGFVFDGSYDQVYAKTGTAEITENRNNKFITCAFPASDPMFTFTLFDIEGKGMSTDLKSTAQDIIHVLTDFIPTPESEN